MSTKNYEISLCGTSAEAATALEEIRQKMLSNAKKGNSFQLPFAYSVLKSICKSIVARGTNYTIYCDIFVNVLMPNVDPTTNTIKWNHYLEMVRYFYYLLSDRKLHIEMAAVYGALVIKPNKMQSENDFEFIYGTYMQHLHAQKSASDSDSSLDDTVDMIYKDVAELFAEMLRKNVELNFVYKDLTNSVTRFLIPKKSQSIYKFIASAPNKKCMFDALFKLLAEMRAPQISAKETKALFLDYMDALMLFAYIDASVLWTGDQIALRFLRVCRDLTVFKSDKLMAYSLSLLYYFTKLIFAQNEIKDFVESYLDLCEKFRTFFERYGETLKTESWFLDFVVVLSLLISLLDLNNLVAFSAACTTQAQAGSIELNNTHFLLILDLIKLAPSITQTKLASWTCCTSTRKHTILLLARAAFKYYSFFVAIGGQQDPPESDQATFQKTFITIMRHSVRVIDSMICINSSSAELQSFYSSFSMLLSKITTGSQVTLCVALTEVLLAIQTKFTPELWAQLLLRLRQATPARKSAKLIAEMHAIHIGFMIKLNHSNHSAIQRQIGIFYTSEHLWRWDFCLLEILEMSKSPLKPTLDANDKRMLHLLESQFIFKYQKSNLPLHTSLLKCSQTNLDIILVARECRQLDGTHERVERICKQLQLKMKEFCGLNRLEKLTLAHAYTFLLGVEIEKMKKVFDNFKDFSEDSLEKFLLCEKIRKIDASSELYAINMAVEALNLFKLFYSTADSEPISSSEALLDWEAVMTDVSFLARLLQLRGYIQQSLKAWLLLYRISNCLEDSNNIVRSLAFLCEYAATFEGSADINLAEEVNAKTQTILNTLQTIPTLLPRRQNYILLCLCQLAYYYARAGNFNYANLLLKLVETKHSELTERRDKFDFICASVQAVRFRISWKLIDSTKVASTESICVLRQIEAFYTRFRNFVVITSEDCWNYMTLMFGVIQEFAECTINRLCDYNVKSFYTSILKAAVEMGCALRVVQCLTSWALANLQEENVDKAQTKLKLVEYFLGIKSVEELSKVKSPAPVNVIEELKILNLNDALCGSLLSLQENPGMLTMRRVAKVQLSPAMKDKLSLSCTAESTDLQRYLKHDSCDVLAKNSMLQWLYVAVGYTNARLFFLVEDFSSLEKFYQESLEWCEKQKNSVLLLNFQNLQLLGMQHYMNYLRAHGRHDQALEWVESALSFAQKAIRNVDKVYQINLEQQKLITKHEMLQPAKSSSNRLRRALEFQLSPEEEKCARAGEKKVLHPIEDDPKTERKIKKSVSPSDIIMLDSDTDAEENKENKHITVLKCPNLSDTKEAISNPATNSGRPRRKPAAKPKSRIEDSTSESSGEFKFSPPVLQAPARSRTGLTSKKSKIIGANKENIAVEMISVQTNDAVTISSTQQVDVPVGAESRIVGRRLRKNTPVCPVTGEVITKMKSLNLNTKQPPLSSPNAGKADEGTLVIDVAKEKTVKTRKAAAASRGGNGAGEKVIATFVVKTRSRSKKTEENQ